MKDKKKMDTNMKSPAKKNGTPAKKISTSAKMLTPAKVQEQVLPQATGASLSQANLVTSKSSKQPRKVGAGKGKYFVENAPESKSGGGRGGATMKAGLRFSVARVARRMKMGRYAERIGGGAPIYMASALQYIVSEICELAAAQAEKSKK